MILKDYKQVILTPHQAGLSAESARRMSIESIKNKIEIIHEKTDDLRSYHVSSKKIELELGFIPKKTINDAVESIHTAFDNNLITNSKIDDRYYNIKTMQNLNLQ